MNSLANSDGKLPKHCSINEIEKATDNFSDENHFATGGNGNVYRGILDSTKVAIKCPIECNDIEINHISNEIYIHGQVKHPNIVLLCGYSLHPNKPCVVYEYMPKGSLFNHLHLQGTFLHWHRRLTVAYQITEALIHLHDSVPKIIHVDVKSANILFDDNLNAYLSDFGHSQIIERGKSHKRMPAEGTPALIDPRWRETRILTDKTDVYCFEILLLELLTSKKVIEFEKGKDGAFLVEKLVLMEAVDQLQKDGMRQVVCNQMMEIHSLAIKCMSRQIEDRPSMKEVAKQIQRIRN